MIRIAGTAALGLILNACPFGASEPPDGYARVVGQVVTRDGSVYVGRVGVGCRTPWDPQPLYMGGDRADPQGSYAALLKAPYGSRPRDGEPFEFECEVAAVREGDLFAVGYVTLPFSPDRRTARTTRIDLVEGEMETPP